MEKTIKKLSEIIIHTHLGDGLPKSHPACNSNIHCIECMVQVHADNNKCMRTWYETPAGNLCTDCFEPNECIDDEANLKECINGMN